jgi:1-pyrroline-5-carboxylate dehydrogenase
MLTPYKHEPFTDFTVESNRQAFEVALRQVENELGKEYPLLIG